MPKPPGIISRANYVVDSWNNPCQQPWVVYAETALPAALTVWIAFICFDIGDVVRFMFRPARLRSGRHIRRGRKGERGRRKQGLGRRAAMKLPMMQALTQRKVSQGVKNLWIIDGIGQRLLWWWLIADVASGFLYNWTSMVRKTEFCQAADSPGNALREDTQTTVAAIGGWQSIGFDNLRYQVGSVTMGPFGASLGTGGYEIAVSANATNRFAQATTIQLRLISVTQGGLVIGESEVAALPPLGSAALVVTARIGGPAEVAWQARVGFGGADMSGGAAVVFGRITPRPPIQFTCPIPFVGNP